MRDQGNHMSSDATFHVHIARTITLRRRVAGWLLRSFRTRDKDILLLFWRNFVLSHPDHYSLLWSLQSISWWQNLKQFRAPSQKRWLRETNELLGRDTKIEARISGEKARKIWLVESYRRAVSCVVDPQSYYKRIFNHYFFIILFYNSIYLRPHYPM